MAALLVGGILWLRANGVWRTVGMVAFVVAVAYLALEGWKFVMGRRSAG